MTVTKRIRMAILLALISLLWTGASPAKDKSDIVLCVKDHCVSVAQSRVFLF